MVRITKKAAKKADSTHKSPAAPWIYINDSTQGGYITEELTKLIPNTFLVTTFHIQNRFEYRDSLSKAKGCVNIIRDTRGDGEDKAKKDAIRIVKATAIKAGVNFVSVNILNNPFLPDTYIGPDSTNHLDLAAGPGSAQAIYKWLCKSHSMTQCVPKLTRSSYCAHNPRNSSPHFRC